jgi:RHS repeat-associated protein
MVHLMIRRFLLGLFVFSAIFCFVPLVLAQGSLNPDLLVTNATQTPIEGVGHSYLHDMSETVNPQNGQVSIRIAGPAPHERGPNFPHYAYMYDTSGREAMTWWPELVQCESPDPGYAPIVCDAWVPGPGFANYALNQFNFNAMNGISGPNPTILNSMLAFPANQTFTNPQIPGGVNNNAGKYSCQYNAYTYFDSHGGIHDLNLHIASTSNPPTQSCSSMAYETDFVGGDSSIKAACQQNANCPAVNAATSDGTLIIGAGTVVGTIEDTNGNNDDGTGRPMSYTTTTVNGRPQPLGTMGNLSSYIGLASITLPGVSGAYTYNYSTFSRSSTIGLSASVNQQSTGGACLLTNLETMSQSTTFADVSSLGLPNGQSFTFGYDGQWGLINSITYPTGGTVIYTWGVNSLSESYNVATPNMWDGFLQNGPQNCYFEHDLPVVTKRVVSFDGTHPALEQDFAYTTTWGTNGFWSAKTTTVTTIDLVRPGNPKTVTIYNYIPMFPPKLTTGSSSLSVIPHEDTVVYQDGSGNTLRTVKKVWLGVDLLGAECEILPNGMVSGKFYQYQQPSSGYSWSNGMSDQVTDLAEYDYTQGVTSACVQPPSTTAPARETKTQYATIPSSVLWQPYQSATIPQTNDRPSVIQVYDHGTLIAETDFAYDQTSIATVSPTAYNHDETNFGPSQVAGRGNATTITKKCIANCSSSPVTTAQYDETGQIVAVTDPNGNTTTLSYTDNYSTGGTPPGNTNTYVTKITPPITNGFNHVSSFAYHYTFGELTSATDENLQTSTYQYNDTWGRPTLAVARDGGQTEITYNDTAPSPTVTTCQLISGTPGATCNAAQPPAGWKTALATMDGVGQVVNTELVSDPDGATYDATVYDGLGRVYTKSNPYRTTSDPTYGITTYTYDALGRTTKVAEPDGSSVETLYDQTCSTSANGVGTLVTDETGNIRQSCSDGLGRLIEVDEPGAGATDGSPGTGTVTINENSSQISNTFQVCYEQGQPPVQVCQNETVYNSGTINLTVGSAQYSTEYGPPPTTGPFTTSYIANALAGAINGDVTAAANGGGVQLRATTTGTDTNYSLSTTATYSSALCPTTACFSGPSFYASAPPSMTNGTNVGWGTGPLVTLYTYDALNDLTCAVQKGTDTTAFSSCASAPATWRPRSFVYDSLSRLTSATNPESGTATYAYDPNGNLVSRVVPKANQTGTAVTTHTYTYDALNRLTKESHADPAEGSELYAYDGTALTGCPVTGPPTLNSPTYLVGRRSAMCADLSGSAWSYDPMGRPLFEGTNNKGTSSKEYTVGYTYWLDGSLKTVAYPSGDVVTYTVGGAGRTTQVADSANITFVSPPSGTPMYAPHGALAGMVNGSIVTNNSYNNRLQPFMLSAGVNGQSAIFSLCYDFHLRAAITACNLPAYTTGNNGNVFQVLNEVDPTRSAAYAYDSLNRLAQAKTVNTTSPNCWGETYTIDNWGNLTSRSVPSGMSGSCLTEALSATATTKNQLSWMGMTYDAAGSVTKDNVGNTPTYDQENRISTVAGYTYYYDADGRRMEKTTGSTATMYWLGPSGTLTETSLAGTINEEYIYFNGERLARVDRPSGTIHYYFSDQLGSASVIASPTALVQEQYFYYPYGGMQSSTGSDPNNYKFTGKERDAESGLDNFGARYFASTMGRFMSPDWAARPTAVPYAVFGDPQSLNLYTYVRNDPVSRADADGHEVDLDNKKKADRDETQRRLVSNTSKAEQKLFKSVTDPKTGKTTLALTDAAKSFKGSHTVAFTRLADAIGQKNVASVGIHDTFVGADGQSHATPLGGITTGPAPGIAGNATTTLNPKGLGAWDMSVLPGTNVPAPMEIVAAHEVMGHALEILKGGDPSEHHVWEIENQMRQEQGLPPRPPE